MESPPQTLKECDETEKLERTADRKEDQNLQLTLLPPNHPLLSKFQQTLKEYLTRTKDDLKREIIELRYNVKHTNQLREDHGADLYEKQMEIKRQNEQLEAYAAEVQEKLNVRRREDGVLEKLKRQYEEKNSIMKMHKNDHTKRMNELDNLQTLEQKLRNWAEELQDEVSNKKQIVSRDFQLQQQLSDEKRKTDMLFFNLDVEVKKREKELSTFKEEINDQEQVINVLKQSVSCANTDLETLQNEYKRLTQAWNEVIVAIQHRDKILHTVNTDKEKERELIKLCTVGIEAIKKQITKELDQNQKLQLFKSRLEGDFTNLKRECQKEMDTLTKLEIKLNELPLLLAQTETDLQESRREGNQLEMELRSIQLKLEKLHNRKFEIEENILYLTKEQLVSDKASEYRIKLLNEAQDQRRNIELNTVQSENLLSQTLLEIDQFKGLLFKLRQDNDHLQLKLTEVQERSDHFDSELKNMETQIQIKTKETDKLSRKIEKLTKGNESAEMSTTERKVKLLEKTLQGTETQIREQQQFWLMLQNHFVNLSQKRNSQVNELQVTRKQLSVIKQKSLKIDNDLEKSETAFHDLERNIESFTAKIEMFDEKRFLKRNQQTSEKNECSIEHNEYVEKLKEDENKLLEMEEEIQNLKTDIEHYKELVLDKHRETLSWETKYKLIEETIRCRRGEILSAGEINNMKTEIRRMNVRYSQLKRAQEKLVQDLEHCVMHRENIFRAATAKAKTQTASKRSGPSPASTDWHNSNDIRNKTKQIQCEIDTLTEQNLAAVMKERDSINQILSDLDKTIEEEKEQDKIICAQIEEISLFKQYNLENILRKQNRCKAFRKFIQVDQKCQLSEDKIQTNLEKQAKMNDSLIIALENIMSNFPERKKFFLKIFNSVKH